MPIDRRITLNGFLRAFRQQDRNQPDQPFCFILGAGASKPSKIRTGGELALQFVKDLHVDKNFENEPFKKWAIANRLGIENFQIDSVAEFYPQLYQHAYGEHLDRGYAFLEKEMEGREPSYGYSVLAWILANTPHKVVITPNFDNLVVDALSIYSATFPRVVGHDSLAGFVQAAVRRPLIAKVHGDLGFTPRNTPNEIARLSKEWKRALERVLKSFTPIVIGYGGNDGSLMTSLEGLPKGVPDSIYWCQREGDGVSDRVKALLERKKGRLVVIPGFDELMLKLQDHMLKEWKMPDLLQEMKRRQRQREEFYDKQRREIGARLVAPHGAKRAPPGELAAGRTPKRENSSLAGAAVRVLAPKQGEKPWWQWYQQADTEPDLDKREAIYRAGIAALPKSTELLGSYAIFLDDDRQAPRQAERFYKRAIAVSPKDADSLNNYAVFLDDIREDLNRAETYYKRAIAAAPKDATILGNYAIFLESVRDDPEGAEALYKRAVAAGRQDATVLGNYADFLEKKRQDPNRAEHFYKRAVAADPKHATNLGNYGLFLQSVRWDADRAEHFYKRSIAADPKDAVNLGNYALFLEKVRKNLNKAEEFYKRAIAADPQDATSLGNYADFLEKVRKSYDQADHFYRRAIEADPTNSANLGAYANFQHDIRHRPDRAEKFFQRALQIAPKDPTNLGSYAVFLESIQSSPKRVELVYRRALNADPSNPINLYNYAIFVDSVIKDAPRADKLYQRALAADPEDAAALGAYALFLEKTRKSPDRAEEFYKRSIKADGKDPTNLVNYGGFLEKIRKNTDRAQQFYKKAVAADPEDPTNLGNYAGLLLGLNKQRPGMAMLKRAEAALGDEVAVSIELAFYRLAHDAAAWPEQIRKLRALLEKGARSPGWSFERNIKQAEKNGHPNPPLLRALAKVVNDEAPLKSLNRFADWQSAGRSKTKRHPAT
jgi:Tfp pilus assembly protein PilF